jgi:hypothetical protein
MTNQDAIGVIVVAAGLVITAKAVQIIRSRKKAARQEQIALNKAESNRRHMERMASMSTVTSEALSDFVCRQGAKAL